MSKDAESVSILSTGNDLIKSYDRLSELLSYPESSADTTYYKHLLLQRAKIEKAYPLAVRLIQIQEAPNGNKEELDGLYNTLKQEIIRLGDDGTFAAEMTITGDETCKKHILSSVFELSRTNGFEYLTTDEGAVIKGVGAYAYLKNYVGLHRYKGKPSGEVKMKVLRYCEPETYSEADVRLDVFHSDGAGGQNVNKVETGVRATHLPTNITVTCRDERSQLQNKKRALELIKERVTAFYIKSISDERAKESKLQDRIKKVFNYTDGRQEL